MKASASIHNIQLAVKLTNAPKNRFLPLLDHVKVEAAGDRLTITGTDLELTTKITMPALVDEDGATLLPFANVKKVIEAAGKDSYATFTESSVKAGKAGANLAPLDAREFPKDPSLGDKLGEASFRSTPEFLRQLGNAVKTASADPSYPVLNTVRIHDEGGGKCRLVATDSYRLYVSAVFAGMFGDCGVGLSRWAVELVLKAGKSLDSLRVSHYATHDVALMQLGDMTCEVTCKAIEGRYPLWQQLVPESHDYACEVSRKELEDGAKFIKKMTKADAPVKLDLPAGSVSTTAADGRYSYDVTASHTEDPFPRHVKACYLIDALATSKEQSVTVKTLNKAYGMVAFVNPEGDMTLISPIKVG